MNQAIEFSTTLEQVTPEFWTYYGLAIHEVDGLWECEIADLNTTLIKPYLFDICLALDTVLPEWIGLGEE